jgi:hypothetical protein
MLYQSNLKSARNSVLPIVRRAISRRTPSWVTSVINLVQRRNRLLDRTGLKILENNKNPAIKSLQLWENCIMGVHFSYPTSTRRHGNFAGVHTLLRIKLSSNSAVLINIITGVSPPHFDFFVFYVLCQC